MATFSPFEFQRGISLLSTKTKEAVSEIKELDNTLTKISKTSNLTSKQLKQLGVDSYDTASKFGKTASNYLNSVQEMSRSGLSDSKSKGMAEQSLLAQSSGDMDAELANKYILATNAAYQYNGEAEKINAVLDGQNNITTRNNIAMKDMAAAMTTAGSAAAGYKVSVENLSAMLGTMQAVTKSGGDEVGNASNAILGRLQNMNSSKIVNTLKAANVSMTEMANGTEQLRDPISILRDLAGTFNQLEEHDPLRAEILTNIGQNDYANQLSALLQNMDMYDKMLTEYAQGEGSALAETNRNAENLTGTLNQLSNSWNKFVNSILNSDTLTVGANIISGLLQGVTKLTDMLDPLGSIGLGAGLFAGIKNTQNGGGLIRLILSINNSPFLATVEFSSDAYDSYVYT